MELIIKLLPLFTTITATAILRRGSEVTLPCFYNAGACTLTKGAVGEPHNFTRISYLDYPWLQMAPLIAWLCAHGILSDAPEQQSQLLHALLHVIMCAAGDDADRGCDPWPGAI